MLEKAFFRVRIRKWRRGPLGAEVREERKALFWTLSPLCCFGSLPSSPSVPWHIAPQVSPGPSGRTHMSAVAPVSPYPGPAGCQALPAEGTGSHCMLPGLPSWQMGRVITLPSFLLTFRATVRMSSCNQAYQSHHRSCPWPSLSEPPRRGSSAGQDLTKSHTGPSRGNMEPSKGPACSS